jgi:hypothetical protein
MQGKVVGQPQCYGPNAWSTGGSLIQIQINFALNSWARCVYTGLMYLSLSCSLRSYHTQTAVHMLPRSAMSREGRWFWAWLPWPHPSSSCTHLCTSSTHACRDFVNSLYPTNQALQVMLVYHLQLPCGTYVDILGPSVSWAAVQGEGWQL